jgi:hypothetical protein
MTELFDEGEKTIAVADELLDVEVEEVLEPVKTPIASDARRRLEDLLNERKLNEELDDYFELEDI